MDKAALQAFRSQIYSMEKVLVTMRAYMDHHIQNASGDELSHESICPVQNSLESLLTRFSPDVTERQVSAYEEIVSGVCVGYDANAGTFTCSVKTDTYHDETTTDGSAAGISCLLIYPRIDPEHPLTYFTLETDVSISALRQIDDLTLDFVPAFNALSEELVGNFSLYLRLYFQNSRHQDFHHKSYPVMGTPLAFSYTIDKAQYELLPLDEAIGARIIINLPRATSDLNRILVSSFTMTGARVE